MNSFNYLTQLWSPPIKPETYRMIVQHELNLVQLDQPPDRAERQRQVVQKRQRLAYDLLRMSEVLQVGNAVKQK